jgi:2-polyprenyl-3-methyl-5-hydroxy-6-metoxy-1,4-benzoquinol methylase
MPDTDRASEHWTLREAILGSAAGYRTFKVVTRGDETMRRMADEYVRPEPGDRILDVGCGYGDLSAVLRDVSYVGVDMNRRYIAFAQRQHHEAAEFVVGDVTKLSKDDLGDFDCAVAIGVLHHLNDAQCTSMLEAVSTMLRPNGRFVAAEPTWDPNQRTTARVLAALDRGRYVRERSRYEALVAPWFASTVSDIRHDLFWFPYTHCMITATMGG